MAAPKTLFDKIWGDHVVGQPNENQYLLYIDRHLVHEVTSPQAFEGLKLNNRKVRRPDLTLGVADHNVPTTARELGINSIKDEIAKLQVDTLEKNLTENNIKYIPLKSKNQGIVHIYEPDLDDLVSKVVDSGLFSASLEPSLADIFIIAVPTPFYQSGKINPQPNIDLNSAINIYL